MSACLPEQRTDGGEMSLASLQAFDRWLVAEAVERQTEQQGSNVPWQGAL